MKFWAFGLLLGITVSASHAHAELYKYQGPNGEVLITTEARPDLKLLEVIEGKAPAKQTSKPKATTKNGVEVKTTPPDRVVERGEGAFDDIIREASAAYDVPFGFIKAVIRVESNFNPNAVSPVGAMGLMQLMPRTAASVNVTDPFDPRQNIFGGTRFLRILIDRYDGDINLILAAYNAGDAAVARYDGIPYPQTRGYVAHVYRLYRTYTSQEQSE
ncbi:MAG: lytic transglycosylase domain-containing protein [bacterium]